MKIRPFPICLFLVLLFIPSVALGFQDEEARRSANRSEPTSEKPKAEAPKAKQRRAPVPAKEVRRPAAAGVSVHVKPQPPRVKTVPLANLTIQFNPEGSTVLVDENEIESRSQPGVVRLMGIEAARQHLIRVRYRDYAEQQQTLNLSPGENKLLQVWLSPLPGRLSVDAHSPEVEISITKRKNETSDALSANSYINIGTYYGHVDGLTLVPGQYQIDMKRQGYKPLLREVTIGPNQTVDVAEVLEPERRRPPRTGNVMQLTVAQDSGRDKQYIVSLAGTSGDDLTQSGSLVVSHNAGQQYDSASVLGMLPGVPSRVDCVALENVRNCSFVETPSAANQWGRVVVRVRFKNPKKSARYSINWTVVGRLDSGGN